MAGCDVARGEIIWERIYDSSNVLRFAVTSDSRREYYYLYRIGGGKWERLKRASTPVELRKYYSVS